jgi:hypothetical protein
MNNNNNNELNIPQRKARILFYTSSNIQNLAKSMLEVHARINYFLMNIVLLKVQLKIFLGLFLLLRHTTLI